MSEIVLTALISAGQAVTLALIGLIGIRLGKVKADVTKVKADAAEARTNSAATREQVENEHRNPDGTVINMRHENDSRHAETKSWIDDLRRAVGRDIGGLREEIRIDRHANAQRFNNLEDRLK